MKGSREGWYWGGFGGHFAGSARCAYHLSTVLPSGWLVSTVGHYLPKGSDQVETLGVDGHTYETMVFGCSGLDQDGNPINNSLSPEETRTYNESRAAERGHYELCEKYAEINRTETEETDEEG